MFSFSEEAESLEHLSSPTHSHNKQVMAALKAESFNTAKLFQPLSTEVRTKANMTVTQRC